MSKTKPKPNATLKPRKVPRRASAYLNMNTAIKDIKWAETCWEDKKDREAVWSIELAIHQLNAARTKLSRFPSKSIPDLEA